MSAPEESTIGLAKAPPKKPVWFANLVAALLLVLAVSLSSSDSLTRVVTALCLSISIGTCYLSLRRRFNVLGALLLLLAVYFYASFLLFIFKNA